MKSAPNSTMQAIRMALCACAIACAALQAIAQNAQNIADPPSAAGSNSTSPPAASYVVGEADVLRIDVWKQPEISQQTVVVRPDGMVSVPLIGDVKVSGLTPSQIEANLVSDLKQYVNEPRVTVSVTEVGSKIVFVTGEVQHPGAYPIVGPLDVLQVIAKAGGVTPYAHRKSVFVLRTVNGKKEKVAVNYSRIFSGKSPEQNIDLKPGDTVVVP